jgi:hypothetical protein
MNVTISREIKTKVLEVPMEAAADAYDVVKHLPELEFRPTVKLDTLSSGSYKEMAEFWALVDDEVVSSATASFAVLEPSNRTLRITNTGFVIDERDWDEVYTGQVCLNLQHVEPEVLTRVVSMLIYTNQQPDSKRFFVTESGSVYLPIEYKQLFLDQLELVTVKSGMPMRQSSINEQEQEQEQIEEANKG